MFMNILNAIVNIINNPILNLEAVNSGRNRANSLGHALELYIKDVFSGAIMDVADNEKEIKYEEVFSYAGNQNNPPDFILKSGDAIEVKKIQSKNSMLALNSSYPKAKLYVNSPMITQACRDCEAWSEKDIIYTVGYVTDTEIKTLWMVYGHLYAADKVIYQRIKKKISRGVNSLNDIEFAETNEIGKIKKVDPLGITDLRVRGMWGIDNPAKVFSYLYNAKNDSKFQFISLIDNDKYNKMLKIDNEILNIKKEGFKITDVRIKNPNNPIHKIQGKLITYVIK